LEAVTTINLTASGVPTGHLTGQLQDSGFKSCPHHQKIMAKKKNEEEKPLVVMGSEEREEAWDDVYVKEEGIVLEFNAVSNTGKIKSLRDNAVYNIDSRELIRTRIELQSGDKVLFAPFKDPDGNDYARVIRIIELNT
jgi:hypothetical protein